MKRKSMSKKQSKSNFTRNAVKINKRNNNSTRAKRGGIRL